MKITKFCAPRVAKSLKVMTFNSSAPMSASAGVLSLSPSSCHLEALKVTKTSDVRMRLKG